MAEFKHPKNCPYHETPAMEIARRAEIAAEMARLEAVTTARLEEQRREAEFNANFRARELAAWQAANAVSRDTSPETADE
jgi:hypothetical protein